VLFISCSGKFPLKPSSYTSISAVGCFKTAGRLFPRVWVNFPWRGPTFDRTNEVFRLQLPFWTEYAKYTPTNFKLKRALVVTKLSRYEFEQLRHPELSPDQLQQKLRDRGTDVEMVLHLHNVHKDFERQVVQSFQDVGCEVKLSSRCVHPVPCSPPIQWSECSSKQRRP